MTITELNHASKAALMWDKFDVNARAGIRFGMFPFGEMQDAEREGYDGQKLAVALMDIAINRSLGDRRKP